MMLGIEAILGLFKSLFQLSIFRHAEQLSTLQRSLSECVSTRDLGRLIVRYFSETLHIRHVLFLRLDGQDYDAWLSVPVDLGREDSHLIYEFQHRQQGLVTGIMAVGKHKRRRQFSSRDLRFLSAVCAEIFNTYHLLSALEAARIELHSVNQSLRHLNNYLDQQVRQQTRSIRRASVELQHAKEASDTAMAVKSRFLATMSHELRTPLHVIIGVLDRLRRDTSADVFQSDILDMQHYASVLLNLVDDVLDWSRSSYLRDSADDTGDTPREDPVSSLTDDEKRRLKTLRVLACDDNGFNRVFLRMILADRCDFNVVSRPEDVLDRIAKETFDVILLDIQMDAGNAGPMSGVDLMRTIRISPSVSKAVIVAMTAQVGGEDDTSYLKMGFDHYLPKPFTEMDLLMVLLNA